MRDLDELFAALARAPFRAKFRLGPSDAEYLRAKGLPVVVRHAEDLVARRLAPAEPKNDGKQTPPGAAIRCSSRSTRPRPAAARASRSGMASPRAGS